MVSGHLIREARLRAGISQQALAKRLGTSQSVIGRWETGARTPTTESLMAAVRACGLELHLGLANRDPDHDRLIADCLRLTPEERIQALLERVEAQGMLQRAVRDG